MIVAAVRKVGDDVMWVGRGGVAGARDVNRLLRVGIQRQVVVFASAA